MKVLTLTQPYATLVAIGAKRIETRNWHTRYRGPLAIHAAQGLGPVGGLRGFSEICTSSPFWEVLNSAGYCGHHPRQPERGAIVAVCELHTCVSTIALATMKSYNELLPNGSARTWRLTDQERAFGDYSPNRYAWLLWDIRVLPEPIPAKGALGLWDYDRELPL